MAKLFRAGVSAIAFVVSLGLSAAHADPTAAQNDPSFVGAVDDGDASADDVEAEGGNLAVISDDDLDASAPNYGTGPDAAGHGDAGAAGGGAAQGNYQQWTTGAANSPPPLSTSLGAGQLQGTIAATNAR